MNQLIKLFILAIVAIGCQKSNDSGQTEAKLRIVFKFDSTQQRLNNIGQPATLAAGHGAQSPVMNTMSAHYVELAPDAFTQLGKGAILYKATETTLGGTNAIDFSAAHFAGDGDLFLEIPLKDVPAGQYLWFRISLAYQNLNLKFRVDTTINTIGIHEDLSGTIAGFIGYNTYISKLTIAQNTVTVNSNKLQGFWGFETTLHVTGTTYPFTSTGQAPAAATTVVNPIFASSPIPAGSCVVTAGFLPGALTITGKEISDITIEASFSTNKSVEWIDTNGNGLYEPVKGEQLHDMGIRGMIPRIL